jgi:ribosomal protein S18 acetylase RimI-like enzyme
MTGEQIERPQLGMIWPKAAVGRPVLPDAPSGYGVRTYRAGDEGAFLRVIADGDFGEWDADKLAFNIARVIPGGWFFAVETASDVVVGSVMCLHNYTGKAPFAGDIGWLVCGADHRGHGLGLTLTLHATRRFLDAGYSHIQLHTEHHRLPAIKTYLKAGYVPAMYCRAMQALWEAICDQINWPFTPEAWQ